jgi:hypothetical protein
MHAQEKTVLSQTIQLQSKLGDSTTELNITIVARHAKSLIHRLIDKINKPTTTVINKGTKTTTHLATT